MADSEWNLICVLLFLTTVASAIDVRNMNIDEYMNYVNPPAVHKFRNEHGDTILCVPYTDQISLQGSERLYKETMDNRKLLKSGLNFSSYGFKSVCPEGTVPIVETKRELVERAGSVAQFIRQGKNTVADDGAAHEYGTAIFIPTEPINGASAGMNLWQPYVDTGDNGVFSLGQMWVLNNGSQSLESVEVGWTVNPSLYGDSYTRFFTAWTADGYQNTGCWNTYCPGFVLGPGVSATYLGARVAPVSTYNGAQRQIFVKVIKEAPKGTGIRWSLYVNNDLIGWWPASLFKNLQSNSNRVDFGGEVTYNPGATGTPLPKTDMGSGHFASEGCGRSAHMKDIQITNDHGVPIDIPGIAVPTKPQCYDVSIVAQTSGKYVFFGGPGGDHPGCVVS